MVKFRRYLLSLVLCVSMALTAFGAATVSAKTPCTGMMPGMTETGTAETGMASKGDPCQPKAPECMDMSGCVLTAVKLAEPLELERRGFWSVEVYSAFLAAIPASTDIRPDHSPPKHIA